jgi:hypothetical protein
VEAAPHLIIGEVASWASVANVKPTRIPGYWYDKPGADIPIGQKPMPGEKVIYSLHGGGYTQLSAHPNDSIGASSEISSNIVNLSSAHSHSNTASHRLIHYRAPTPSLPHSLMPSQDIIISSTLSASTPPTSSSKVTRPEVISR